jgi:hypothetical protein
LFVFWHGDFIYITIFAKVRWCRLLLYVSIQYVGSVFEEFVPIQASFLYSRIANLALNKSSFSCGVSVCVEFSHFAFISRCADSCRSWLWSVYH